MLAQQRFQAEVVAIGLATGYLSCQDTVDWADRVVEIDPFPDAEVIDISLGGGLAVADMLPLLRLVKGEFDRVAVAQAALADLLAELDAHPEHSHSIAFYLYRMACGNYLPESHFGMECYAIEDHFHMAKLKVYGTEESAERELRSYLSRYAAPHLRFLPKVSVQ